MTARSICTSNSESLGPSRLTCSSINLKASHLILACRNATKGEAARKKLMTSTRCQGTNIEVWNVDLDVYQSVLAFCDRINSDLTRLDGFIANAGIELDAFELSEGCERTLTINVISTFLMAYAVLPKLHESATRHKTSTNLTLVGSLIHVFGADAQLRPASNGKDIFAALSDPKTANMAGRYSLSKLIEHLCFLGLSEDVRHTVPDVTINLVNPGWCKTELSRMRTASVGERIAQIFFQRTSEQGSRTLVHGVTAAPETNGEYLSECKIKQMSSFVMSARGQELQKIVSKDLKARIEAIRPGVTKLP